VVLRVLLSHLAITAQSVVRRAEKNWLRPVVVITRGGACSIGRRSSLWYVFEELVMLLFVNEVAIWVVGDGEEDCEEQ
jgi:hypothetical protein